MGWAAKAVVERPNLGVALVGLFVCIGALAVRGVWQLSFHPLLQSLALLLDVSIVGRHPFGGLRDKIDRLDNYVYRSLSDGIKWGGHHFIQLLLWIAYQATMIGVAVAAITYELLLAIRAVHRRTEPTFIQQSVKPLVKPVTNVVTKTKAVADTRVPAIEREIASLRARVDAQQAELAQVRSVAIPAPIPYPATRPRTAPVPVPVPVPRTLPRVADLSKGAGNIRAELKRLAKYLTPAGIIGLVGATVFTRFELGWLRCRGVGRVGRSLCGASGLIEALYAGAITAFAVSDLCRFAYGIERAAETIRPLMLDFVDVENALFRCSSASFPKPLKIAATSPTPVIDAIAL